MHSHDQRQATRALLALALLTWANWTLASNAAGGGGHAFWEWGTKGDPKLEVQRLKRAMTAILTTSGYHLSDGTVVAPSVAPIGKRSRELK